MSYNSRQPRDRVGRWTSTGFGAVLPAGRKSSSAKRKGVSARQTDDRRSLQRFAKLERKSFDGEGYARRAYATARPLGKSVIRRAKKGR